MSVDTLVGLIGLSLALIALLPRARQLDLFLRLRLRDFIVAGATLGYVAYLLYYQFFVAIGRAPAWPLTKWFLLPSDMALVLTLLLCFWLVFSSSRTRLSRAKISQFRQLTEELYRTGNFADLFDLIERHLGDLIRIQINNYIFPTIRGKLQRYVQRRQSSTLVVSQEVAEHLRNYIQQSRALPPYGGQGRFLRQINNVLNGLRNLTSRMVANIATKVAASLPDYQDSASEATETFRLVLVSNDAVSAMCRVRPYFLLKLVDSNLPFFPAFVDLYLKELLREPNSILYYEVRISANRRSGYGYQLPASNRLLTCFFSDARVAERLGVWQPIGNKLLQILDELGRSPSTDYYNFPIEDFDTDGKWQSSLFVGVVFFDIMVSSAIYQGIPWHMDVHYYFHITRRIVHNYRLNDSTLESLTDWPTKYSYMLYVLVSTLRGWIRMTDELPKMRLDAILDPKSIYQNENIVGSSIFVLCESLREIVLATSISKRFKQYIADIVFDLYFDLRKRSDRRVLSAHLLTCLKIVDSEPHYAFLGELTTLFENKDKHHYATDQVAEFVTFLTAVHGNAP